MAKPHSESLSSPATVPEGRPATSVPTASALGLLKSISLSYFMSLTRMNGLNGMSKKWYKFWFCNRGWTRQERASEWTLFYLHRNSFDTFPSSTLMEPQICLQRSWGLILLVAPGMCPFIKHCSAPTVLWSWRYCFHNLQYEMSVIQALMGFCCSVCGNR